jgi:hypothetical protein
VCVCVCLLLFIVRLGYANISQRSIETSTCRKRQEKHEISYQQGLLAIREKIKQTEGPDMKERLQDQIRQWFIECRLTMNTLKDERE